MEVQLESGKYIVAVSGGVDSVSLLNMLSKQKDLDLVVTHFDHGIRQDSSADSGFVENLAKQYGLAFTSAQGHLGPNASEATAREARYSFLRGALKTHNAKAILTAHHQDDLLETAIINLLRGTGRKGLASFNSTDDVIRPLLNAPKSAILQYAKDNGLQWHEDSTNIETKYLRNYIRKHIMPRLEPAGRKTLLKLIAEQRTVNVQLDALVSEQPGLQSKFIHRQWFNALPHAAAREVMAAWLRTNGVANFDRVTIERAVVGAKTARAGKKIALKNDILIEVKGADLALIGVER